MDAPPLDRAAFRAKYGPWALVTGAAEGLGAEFASQLASCGANVLLVDVQAEKARAQAARIAREHAVLSRAVECDLASPDFLAGIGRAAEELEIGLLVCCAALGTTGGFLDTPLEAMRRTIQVNCLSTLALVRHFALPMVGRGRGGILIVASNAAYAGSPFVANYAATKAYELTLGEALWYELAPHGVDVLAFSPQGTNTPGMRRGMPNLAEGEVRDGIMLPAPAVRLALGALGRIASLRPDLPEEFSRSREKVIRAGGDFTRKLSAYQADR